MLWAFGGCLVQSSRVLFEEFVKGIADRMFPSQDLFEFYYDFQAGWTPWKNKLLVEFQISPN